MISQEPSPTRLPTLQSILQQLIDYDAIIDDATELDPFLPPALQPAENSV